MKRLSDGATEVRLSLSDTRYVRALFICSFFLNIIRLLDEAAASDQLARELLSKASDIVSGLESNSSYPACFISFTHRRVGPVANVETLLGKVTSGLSQAFLNLSAELRQLDISIRNTVSSITELKVCLSRLHFVLSHVTPRIHLRYTVCVGFDKSVL